MKQWFKRLLAGLCLLLLAVVGVLAFLLGTNTGTQWVLSTGGGFLPGALTVKRVEGHLLGGLSLCDVAYRAPAVEVEVRELELQWVPAALMQGVFHVRDLTVDGLRLDLMVGPSKEKPPPVAGEPLGLSDISLPLVLQLDRIQMMSTVLMTNPEAAPIRIDLFSLALLWDRTGLDLRELRVVAPEWSADMCGTIQPTGNYPLEITTDVAVAMPERLDARAKGSLSGDLEELRFELEVAGDIRGKLTGRLGDILTDLQWDAALDMTHLRSTRLPLEIPSDMHIDAQATGDLQRADARLALNYALAPVEPADRAAAAAADRRPRLEVSGEVDFAAVGFQVAGECRDLQWPLRGVPLVQVDEGRITVSGTVEDFGFEAATVLDGKDIPRGRWTIEGRGSTQQIQLSRVEGDVLDGRIEGRGNVAWAPALTWSARLSAQGMNPGSFSSDWPGSLDIVIESEGELKDEQLSLSAGLERLSGTLRDRNVAGSGRFRMTPEGFEVDQVTLSSGSSRIELHGSLGEQWCLDWQLRIPDVADLLPGGAGLVDAEGMLRGEREKPQATGTLRINNLSYQETRCDQAEAEFSAGLDPSQPLRFFMSAHGLSAMGQTVPELTMRVDGALPLHDLDLSVTHRAASVHVNMTGGYDLDRSTWEGEVRQFEVRVADVGQWALQASCPVAISPDRQVLSSLCLVDEHTELCAEADWSPTTGRAKVTLSGLSLERAEPYLPNDIHSVEGIVHATATARREESLQATFEAVIEPGGITYLNSVRQPIRLDHRDGRLQAVLDDDKLSTRFQWDIGNHRLAGNLTVPREPLQEDPLAAALGGEIRLAVTDLELLSALFAEIQQAAGWVDVQVQIGGTVGDPRISGNAELRSSHMLIPAAGLSLTNLYIQAGGGAAGQVQLIGAVRSGEGTLSLVGALAMDAEKGWPLSLVLTGDRFLAANLPEAVVVISPNLNLKASKSGAQVRGYVLIPRCQIELDEIPQGSTSVSADQVMVGGDGEEEALPGSQFDADLTVELGDEVDFKGFGLEVDLGGRLTVRQRPNQVPTANGELKINAGSFRAFGQRLKIGQGRISFAGGPFNNPGINLRAGRDINTTAVGVDVTGTARRPQITTWSNDPDLPETDRITAMVTGRLPRDAQDPRVFLGRDIGPNLSVGVFQGRGSDSTEFVTRFRLWDRFDIEGASSVGRNRVTFNHSWALE